MKGWEERCPNKTGSIPKRDVRRAPEHDETICWRGVILARSWLLLSMAIFPLPTRWWWWQALCNKSANAGLRKWLYHQKWVSLFFASYQYQLMYCSCVIRSMKVGAVAHLLNMPHHVENQILGFLGLPFYLGPRYTLSKWVHLSLVTSKK